MRDHVKIWFAGAGNIVRALIEGILKSGVYRPQEIGIYDISQDVCDLYKKEGYIVYSTMGELLHNAQLIVVAVTPQVMEPVIKEIKDHIMTNALIVSLVAGISNNWYEKRLGEHCKVVRCMPTVTAHAGMGAFAIARSNQVSNEDFEKVRFWLDRCGVIEEIPESLMCEVVPINGSAPAFFYHMAHVFVQEAVQMGFEEGVALRLFAQTMKGSAQMLLYSGMNPARLEDTLLLPGGTTLAALNRMDTLEFDRCLQEGIKACVERCKELTVTYE